MRFDEFGRLPAEERATYFVQAGAKRGGLHPVIIEKDFWVCWVLRELFSIGENHPSMVFKGGTSLSKAYSAIHRFSEDIDISLDRGFFGFSDASDPQNLASKHKQKAAVERVIADVRQYVQGPMLHSLSERFTGRLLPGGWSLIVDPSAADGQALLFQYPSTQPADALPYIRQSVKIEFGGRSDQWPSIGCRILPFVAEALPEIFDEQPITVRVLEAERTFWEKATAVHAFYHMPPEKALPRGSSRHYFDLVELVEAGIAKSALQRSELLDAVRDHKTVFFRDPKAHYDEARVGTLKLEIPSHRYSELYEDYRAMQPMIFSNPTSFNKLQAVLNVLQHRINNGLPAPLGTADAFEALSRLPVCNLGVGMNQITLWYRGRLARNDGRSWYFWMENNQGPYAVILNEHLREWSVDERHGIYVTTYGTGNTTLTISQLGVGPPIA